MIMPKHSEELTNKIIALWNGGHSATEIAKALAGEYALTRNSVIGILHRRGIYREAKPRTMRRDGVNRLFAGAPAAAKAPPPPLMGEPEPLGPLEDIPSGGCRYIHGDPIEPNWRMCGHRQRGVSPYCEYHARITRTPIAPRRL